VPLAAASAPPPGSGKGGAFPSQTHSGAQPLPSDQLYSKSYYKLWRRPATARLVVQRFRREIAHRPYFSETELVSFTKKIQRSFTIPQQRPRPGPDVKTHVYVLIRRMKTTTNPAVSAPVSRPSPEEISRRAYELWLQEGRPPGRDIAHWVEAERQLSGLNTTQSRWHVEASTESSSQNQEGLSLASREDVDAPYKAFEGEAPLATKVERRLAVTQIKAGARRSGSAAIS
jgi:hypothetical protein